MPFIRFPLCAVIRQGSLMVALVTAAWTAQAQTDPLLDFRFFNAPQERKHAQNPWAVTWLVRPDAESFCQGLSRKDGYASRREGCVYWVQAHGQCTVVTTDSTTHSQLGHLYLSCLNAQ